MPVLASAPMRIGLVVLLAATALVGSALLGARSVHADQMGIGEGPSGDYSFGGSDCEGAHADPVGVMFRGKKASANNVAKLTVLYGGWPYDENGGAQALFVKDPNGEFGEYGCRVTNHARAQYPQDGPHSRYHVRYWFIPATNGTSELKTVGNAPS